MSCQNKSKSAVKKNLDNAKFQIAFIKSEIDKAIELASEQKLLKQQLRKIKDLL